MVGENLGREKTWSNTNDARPDWASGGRRSVVYLVRLP